METQTISAGISNVNNTRNNSFTSEESSISAVDIVLTVFKATTMVAIMAGAVLGNLLVISSVIKFERLRVLTNYFIVSLAFADLLVAMLVMPFNFSITILGKWIFGSVMCDIFNSNDVLFSTASILHLCCISMDRYIAIMHPLEYESKMTSRRVTIMIVLTWVASILISYIPIHSQLYTTEENYNDLQENPEECSFNVNRIYAAISSSVSFWIPCTIMIFVYVKIFIEARRQETQIKSSAYFSNGHRRADGASLSAVDNLERKSERKRMKREHKAAKTLASDPSGQALYGNGSDVKDNVQLPLDYTWNEKESAAPL
ncbi:hypothetical protein CHS0354_006354 [Potamilus streckersoni]|uniref:G-protein coupled receptors family 1 profile domain-containing protein n=1 Tax=Potamilus streckersoni TaxID=2493646 RepID=A0AAE0W399_9BIVA|nr:hypothetical protein CHS0354_006354 [Potamilus streckersoni]